MRVILRTDGERGLVPDPEQGKPTGKRRLQPRRVRNSVRRDGTDQGKPAEVGLRDVGGLLLRRTLQSER